MNRWKDAGALGAKALRALTGRTAFCVAFLLLWFAQRVEPQRVEQVLSYILFPWAAALAFPVLTLRDTPRRRGYGFLIALFVWYLVCCLYNRQYSFYINEAFWYQLLFACFIFYPQGERDWTLRRMQVVLYPFMAGFFLLGAVGLWLAAHGIWIPGENGQSIGLEVWSGYRLDLLCQTNVMGALAAMSGMFSAFFFLHSGRVGRMLNALNIAMTVLLLAMSQSRTTAIAWSCCMALLAGRGAYYALRDRRPGGHAAVRFGCAALAGALALGAGLYGLRALCSGALSLMERPNVALAETVEPEEAQEAADVADDGLESRAYDSMDNLENREKLWLGTLRMFADRPDTLLFGVTRKGLWENVGAYEPLMYTHTHLHNAYLQTAAAGGLPSLLLLLAFGAVVAVRAWPLLFGRGGMRGGFVLSLTIVLVLICCLMESYVGFTEDLINVLFFYACGCVMAVADRRA